jgi:hypothetical protein
VPSASPMAGRAYCRRQLSANAAIAASRVGSYPCAARRMWPLWPLAHMWRSCGAIGTLKMRPTIVVALD